MKINRIKTLMAAATISVAALIPGMSSAASEIVDTSNHIYTFSEMQEDLFLLAEKYPGRMQLGVIGTTADNRNIYQVVLGNPNAASALYVQASIHGREWLNTMMVMEQLEDNLKAWDEDSGYGGTVGQIYDMTALYLVPMLNPDGVTISQYGVEGINNPELKAAIYGMKGSNNPARWKANALGVNINTNFPIAYTPVGVPASEGNSGLVPFSEAESVAMANALAQRSFNGVISYHSTEGAIYWNVGQLGEDLERSRVFAEHMHNITGYKLGEQAEPHGLEYNYANLYLHIPSVVVETGTVPCPLPYSQWPHIWRQNQNVFRTMCALYRGVAPVPVISNALEMSLIDYANSLMAQELAETADDMTDTGLTAVPVDTSLITAPVDTGAETVDVTAVITNTKKLNH